MGGVGFPPPKFWVFYYCKSSLIGVFATAKGFVEIRLGGGITGVVIIGLALMPPNLGADIIPKEVAFLANLA